MREEPSGNTFFYNQLKPFAQIGIKPKKRD